VTSIFDEAQSGEVQFSVQTHKSVSGKPSIVNAKRSPWS
jgi:hypothetical protein